ncbi:GNAT family N-acetyltransferase [Gorillibacterium massiliense]|uniref:GNAT family N-acetyltransferase n=1 Tax=Gorillibacterium massiliense TaxID=1280390 RepID=UPI0004B7168B|nr:GNAT family N-acetyltransferase [Gorillibacterium massiliense]
MFSLETPRLFLQHLEETDADALHEIFSDAETMTYYPAQHHRPAQYSLPPCCGA